MSHDDRKQLLAASLEREAIRRDLRNIERLADATGSEAEIALLRKYDRDGGGDEVPDPYYGGASGFENVYEMVHRSCQALLSELRAA